jgi:hypothetical protein
VVFLIQCWLFSWPIKLNHSKGCIQWSMVMLAADVGIGRDLWGDVGLAE